MLMTADLHHYGTDYNKALALLKGLTTLFGLPKRNVYIVPGNYDANDFSLKKYLISSISANTEQEANYYIDCYDKLLQGFAGYNTFITDFYGEDSIYKNAAEVSLSEWICDDNPSLGINLIHLNTALICDGNGLGRNIFNIEMLHRLKSNHPEYPSIVIAHHPVSLLFESHANFLSHFITNRNVSAYLCGEMNSDRLEDIKTNTSTNSSIPCIVCSKCSKDTHDTYSDLGCIVYSKIHNMNSVEVSPYSWNNKSFEYSSELEINSGKYVFPLIEKKIDDRQEEPQIYENDSRSVWLPDAEWAVGEQTRFTKYTSTPIVKEFLSENPEFWGLSAVKGIGKTFLLQVKRANMPSNTVCIPIGVTPTENNQWGTDIITLYNTNEKQLLNDEHDTLLWKYCVLAYVTNQIINKDQDTRAEKAVQEIKKGLSTLKVSVETKECCTDVALDSLSLIMEYVLQMKKWYTIIKKDYSTLAKKMKYQITTWLEYKNKERVAIFIDKVDDAYTVSLNASDDKNMAMKNLGISLLKACYEIKQFFSGMIQVFFMIREEIKQGIQDKFGESARKRVSICRPLFYKKEEQKQIFYDCINYQSPDLLFDPKYLDSKEYEKAFVGVDALCHPYIEGLEESVFECIYRHSFDRSRDLQDYGKALTTRIHTIKAIEDERKRGNYIKSVIESQAARFTIGTVGESDESLDSYYDEKKYQLPEYWQDKKTFINLMKMFDKNLLFGKEARKICQKFNAMDTCDGKCATCGVKHFPLEILYKIGLLGRIDSHLSGYKESYSLNFIHSKNVGNIKDNAVSINGVLDDSAYLLHPAYTKAIEAIKREGIRHFGGFLIGKDLIVKKELFTKIYNEYLESEEDYNKTYFFQKQGTIDSFE